MNTLLRNADERPTGVQIGATKQKKSFDDETTIFKLRHKNYQERQIANHKTRVHSQNAKSLSCCARTGAAS